MGDRLGFTLIARVADLRALLDALVRRAEPQPGRGCVVRLPDATEVAVPFASDSEDGPVAVLDVTRPEPAVWLDATLRLPVDAIGRISIFIHVGLGFAVVSLGSSTSSMDRRFEAPAVRAAILDLAREADALGLLDHHVHGPYERLETRSAAVDLGAYDDDDPAAIDRFAERAIAMATGPIAPR